MAFRLVACAVGPVATTRKSSASTTRSARAAGPSSQPLPGGLAPPRTTSPGAVAPRRLSVYHLAMRACCDHRSRRFINPVVRCHSRHAKQKWERAHGCQQEAEIRTESKGRREEKKQGEEQVERRGDQAQGEGEVESEVETQ